MYSGFDRPSIGKRGPGVSTFPDVQMRERVKTVKVTETKAEQWTTSALT
jgi:hypothetical protein